MHVWRILTVIKKFSFLENTRFRYIDEYWKVYAYYNA